MAERINDEATRHHDREEFSRERLFEGGEFRRCCPLHPDTEPEYQEWLRRKGRVP